MNIAISDYLLQANKYYKILPRNIIFFFLNQRHVIKNNLLQMTVKLH